MTIHPFGQCVLQRYRAEIEFNKVTLPGEKAPFLIPHKVVATLETNKGKVEIASQYQPKQAAGK